MRIRISILLCVGKRCCVQRHRAVVAHPRSWCASHRHMMVGRCQRAAAYSSQVRVSGALLPRCKRAESMANDCSMHAGMVSIHQATRAPSTPSGRGCNPVVVYLHACIQKKQDVSQTQSATHTTPAQTLGLAVAHHMFRSRNSTTSLSQNARNGLPTASSPSTLHHACQQCVLSGHHASTALPGRCGMHACTLYAHGAEACARC